MTAPSRIHNQTSKLYKFFGPNRNTHWTIAGSVAVIMLGGYFIYSNNREAPAVMAPTPPAPLSATQ